jgi:hypothetical protein
MWVGKAGSSHWLWPVATPQPTTTATMSESEVLREAAKVASRTSRLDTSTYTCLRRGVQSDSVSASRHTPRMVQTARARSNDPALD